MSAWLVARVITNAERIVSDRLLARDTESYWPRYREAVVDKRTHRKRYVVRPLYPCYLFVRAKAFYFLYHVEGIVGIVMRGEEPATSKRLDEEIAKLRDGESEGLVARPIAEQAAKLLVGSNVVILNGLLRGHFGTCSELRGGRAKVVTKLFGGETPVWHSERDLAVA
jgi:transcription antitermination factor NusG